MFDILSGYKTYIVAVLMVLIGVAGMFGLAVPGFETVDGGKLMMEGLAFLFVRMGIKKIS